MDDINKFIYTDLPYGNGQIVYVDKDWIEGSNERSLFTMNIKQTSAINAYKKMIRILRNNGYTVIKDERLITKDTFFLSPCYDKLVNESPDEYQAKFDDKINKTLSETPVHKPYSILFPEDSFPENLPPLPFMLKNEKANGGVDKFIIRTPEQVETLKKFYYEGRDYLRKIRIISAREAYPEWTKGMEFDKDGRLPNGICIILPHIKKIFHNNYIIQSYVDTPTEYNTSLRVLISSSGDVLCSSLKYAKTVYSTKEENKSSLFEELLADPSSPFFMNNERVVSNTVAGGDSILLGKNYYTNEERRILEAHDINPDNPQVPEEVIETATKIITDCNREIGAICGIDFLYDNKEKKWKYLEEHQFPMLYSFAEAYNLPYCSPKENIFYEVQRMIDINARLKALELMMNKKEKLNENSFRHTK